MNAPRLPSVSTRLLSFLSNIERALGVDEPAPRGGSWENTRTVNYQLGLARLALGSRANGSDAAQPLGIILLQAFKLADGSPCLKANLSWNGADAETETVHAIYAKPTVNWSSEARLIASTWLASLTAPKTEGAASADSLAAAG